MKRSLIAASLAAIVAASTIALAQSPTLQAVSTLAWDNSTMKPTFSAAGYFTAASTPTDMCTLTGSATRNVRVRRATIGGIATAVGTFHVAFYKRSTANSGGTSTTPTVVPYDSQNTGSAVMRIYTANPTIGTSLGALADPPYIVSNATTGVGGGAMTYIFGQLGSPVVLRGTSQVFAMHGNATTISGNVLSCSIEWTEEIGG